MMLKKQWVDQEEERLRALVSELPDNKRKRFYEQLQPRLKDPDTYAVLNWFFAFGIHHFYLGRWINGLVDVGLMLLGFGLFFTPLVLLGVLIWIGVAVWELVNLFRSQIIVQDWNNKASEAVLKEIQ